MYTGIRIGELLALRWEDIDFEKKLLYIYHTITIMKNSDKIQWILGEPKTKKSKRVIPLPINILKELKKMKKRINQNLLLLLKKTNA